MAYIPSRAAQYMLQQYNICSRDPPWDPDSDFSSISSDLLYIESQFDIGKPIKDIMADEVTSGDSIENSSSQQWAW